MWSACNHVFRKQSGKILYGTIRPSFARTRIIIAINQFTWKFVFRPRIYGFRKKSHEHTVSWRMIGPIFFSFELQFLFFFYFSKPRTKWNPFRFSFIVDIIVLRGNAFIIAATAAMNRESFMSNMIARLKISDKRKRKKTNHSKTKWLKSMSISYTMCFMYDTK